MIAPATRSTYGLSVGFPGLEKSSVTPFEYAHKSISLERPAAADKFTAIVALYSFWPTAFNQANPGQFSRNINAFQGFSK
jgi:hypothetical protein